MTIPLPPETEWRSLLERALLEDLDGVGDITTAAVIPAGASARGRIVAREPGVVAGVPVALEVFRMLDPSIRVEIGASEGAAVVEGGVLATVDGAAAPILTGERIALNLLGRLCGIATRTAGLVAAVAHTGVAVAATRKTTPGLRALEKYAVVCGGGRPHRFGLFDAVLIKDNHLAVVGSILSAVRAARAAVGDGVVVEVEVTTLDGLGEAIAAGADAVLLDNMDPSTVGEAVALAAGRVTLEASGGITPETIVAFAETGVDVVSLGWLTHSVPALDVALDFITQ
ncbi:MAG TPA: carboxylating nicotinate-nucleotide diphosphorylase [Acidimicrobiia bacterium]|nr:carboxylating nicotinate-nucleotide diphosphorylase [Acidimicrobiia bacterium]